jgi:hypothetical protein
MSEFKRAARNPWRELSGIKTSMPLSAVTVRRGTYSPTVSTQNAQEVVVLD